MLCYYSVTCSSALVLDIPTTGLLDYWITRLRDYSITPPQLLDSAHCSRIARMLYYPTTGLLDSTTTVLLGCSLTLLLDYDVALKLSHPARQTLCAVALSLSSLSQYTTLWFDRTITRLRCHSYSRNSCHSIYRLLYINQLRYTSITRCLDHSRTRLLYDSIRIRFCVTRLRVLLYSMRQILD